MPPLFPLQYLFSLTPSAGSKMELGALYLNAVYLREKSTLTLVDGWFYFLGLNIILILFLKVN